jgi:uncharacterized protein (DUF2147 family)
LIWGSLLLALPAPAFAAPRAADDSRIVGEWINPAHSIKVATSMAGPTLSGRIIWASEEAREDAKESGITALIGLELLEDYRPDGPHLWKGTVWVPDLGHKFTSYIRMEDTDTLKISGCVLRGLICKSQIWRRTPG